MRNPQEPNREALAQFYGDSLPALLQVKQALLDGVEALCRSCGDGDGASIEHWKVRMKSPESTREKLRRKGLPETPQAAVEHLRDLVGLRLVCTFPESVYAVAKQLRRRFQVWEEKDYIRSPKPNGYRSYHMILGFSMGDGGTVFAEVQLRTIAMDCWASLEHQLKYKHSIPNQDLIVRELKRCADELASADLTMQTIHEMLTQPTLPKNTKEETTMKLLLAEDERELSRAVVTLLGYQGFEADAAYDGEEALTMAMENRYDGILLDIMMPKRDGLSVLRILREQGDTTPIMMLTAKSEVSDRVAGLEQGANDYLTKPFAMKELVARIRAMIRTQEQRVPSRIEAAGVRMNRDMLTLEGEEGWVSLNGREFLLLEQLLCHPNVPFTRAQLLEKICPGEKDASMLSLYLSYLRHKLRSVGARADITEPAAGVWLLNSWDAPVGEKSNCASGGTVL